MKITDVQAYYCYPGGDRNWIFTAISTDEGITGYSEVGMNKETTVFAAIMELRPFLIGKDPTRIEALWQRIFRDAYWTGTIQTTALSAIDMACWDILGKSLGVPVYKLLGGATRQAVRLYAHVYADNQNPTPESVARHAKEVVSRGYTGVKVTMDHLRLARTHVTPDVAGDDLRPRHKHREGERLSTRTIDLMAAAVGAIRDAIGPEVDLMVDCHGRFTPHDAIRLGHALEEFNLLFFEEPIPPDNLEAMVEVHRSVRVPLAAGERLITKYEFWELLGRRAVDVIQPDIANTGGILEIKKIAAMAEATYMVVAPHNPNGPLATLANAHFAASTHNFLILETLGTPRGNQIGNELIDLPLDIRDGYLYLPDRPGLGANLKLDEVAKRPYVPPPAGN